MGECALAGKRGWSSTFSYRRINQMTLGHAHTHMMRKQCSYWIMIPVSNESINGSRAGSSVRLLPHATPVLSSPCLFCTLSISRPLSRSDQSLFAYCTIHAAYTHSPRVLSLHIQRAKRIESQSRCSSGALPLLLPTGFGGDFPKVLDDHGFRVVAVLRRVVRHEVMR